MDIPHYKSIICQEEAYLLELVRYIHLNPLRARAVADIKALDRYPYCGHSALTGEKKRPWQDVEYVLGYFGKQVLEARKGYGAYVREGIPLGRRPELKGGFWGRILDYNLILWKDIFFTESYNLIYVP